MGIHHHRYLTCVLAELYRTNGHHEIAQDLLSCRKHAPCGLSHCPRCEASEARRRRNRLYFAYGSLLDQHPRMQPIQLVTMTLADINIDTLGAALPALNKATGQVLNSTSTYGWYRQIEVVPARAGGMWANVHSHAVLFLPQRQTVTEDHLRTVWTQATAATAVTARGLLLEPADSLEGALTYWSKAENTAALTTSWPFFSAYADQTAGKQLHRFHQLPKL